MKNFRKVLALVLVVATLFSFVAMTASAKEYTDGDKVSYTEAVDVLSAIGILNGYNDGSYRPTNTIKRSEMAKMVAVLSNAGDDIGDLYAAACKFADMNGNAVWAKSYVAYCNEMGIVAGRNATTFDPEGKVTGIETAKMLLCLIGFDAKAQGYVGTNWKTHVLADAKNVGLLAGFAADYEADKAITREEAAQMMLNALKAPMVIGTLSANIVNITNNVWLDKNGNWLGVGINHITLADAAKQYGWYVLYGNVVVSPIPVWTNYDGLTCVTDYKARDCYGNPGTRWTYENSKGTLVFDAVYTATPDFSYTTTATTLATDLKQEVKNGYEYLLYVDGMKQGTGKWADLNDGAINAIKAETGKGVLTNVYVDDVNDTVLVTVKNTYLDVVDGISKHDNSFILHTGAAVTVKPEHGNATAFSNKAYGFAKDDVVLTWYCNGTCDGSDGYLHNAAKATVVTGKVQETKNAPTWNADGSSVKVDGKTYEYSAFIENDKTANTGMMDMSEVKDCVDGATYDLFLDEYGYIIYWRKTPVNSEYVYAYAVEGTLWKDTSIQNPYTDGTKYYVDMVDFKGELHEDVEINRAAYEHIEYRSQQWLDNYIGALIRYQVKNDVATMDPAYAVDMSTIPATTGAVLTANGDVKEGNSIVYGDSETLYMVRTRDYSNGGKYVYTVMTHDEIKTEIKGYINDGYDSFAKSIRSIQYFSNKSFNNTEYLDYVFIDAMYSATAQRAYVTSGKQYTVSADYFVNYIGKLELYKAWINGEEAYLAVEEAPNNDLTAHTLYKANLQVIGMTYDKVPVYGDVKAEPVSINDAHTIGYNNGHVSVWKGDEQVPGVSFNVTDDTFVVVTVCTGGVDCDDSETVRLKGVENVNDYLEGYFGGTNSENDPTNYYVANTSWLLNSNGVITNVNAAASNTLTELYIVIGHTANNPHA